MATKLMPAVLLVLIALKLSAGAGARSDDSPCGFPAIFNLGDSNSDTGAFPALFPAVQPPYGRTFFGMPAGRQSDGRLTIDFMGTYVSQAPSKQLKTGEFYSVSFP